MRVLKFWTILHPGTLERLIFDNRVDAEQYYEGFNPIIPLREIVEINWIKLWNEYTEERLRATELDVYACSLIQRLVEKQIKG